MFWEKKETCGPTSLVWDHNMTWKWIIKYKWQQKCELEEIVFIFKPTLMKQGFLHRHCSQVDFLWYQLWFNDYKSAWNKSDLSSLHLDFWKCLNTGFTSKQSDGDTVMAPKRWCWFHGNFSMRSFFFFSLLPQWRVRPCHCFPSLFWNSDVNLFRFFQLKRVPRKSGMKVYSSNVDKRTCLILCRCVWELCCPRWKKRTPHGKKFNDLWANNISDQYSWFWLSAWCSREAKGGNPGTCAHSFRSLEELLVCRIT